MTSHSDQNGTSRFAREYDPVRTSNRLVAYNKHRLNPFLVLPSRVAWALAHVASKRGVYVADLIVELLTAWEADWEEELDGEALKAFRQSIPQNRPELQKPNAKDGDQAEARQETLPW